MLKYDVNINKLATITNNRLGEDLEEDYRRLPNTENKGDESMVEESKRVPMAASSNDVPNTAQLEKLLERFFEIIETYCEEQSSDIWKSKLIDYWAGKRAIKVEAIRKIDSLDWTNITKPLREDEKFEFQFNSRHSLSAWTKSYEVEDRMLAHCKFIHRYALLI